jgi:hypothetical protein
MTRASQASPMGTQQEKTVAEVRTEFRYDDPNAQTVYEGQLWVVEVQFYLPKDASEQEVEEGVEFALFGGSMDSDHPLIDADFRKGEVTRAHSREIRRFTDWGPEAPDGSRRGVGRSVRA